jgi:agmatinase
MVPDAEGDVADRPRKSMDPLIEWQVPTVYDDTPTFLAVPHCPSADDLPGADVALLGTPYHGVAPVARTYSSTVMMPIALRQYSVKYAGYLPELDVDVLESLQLVDCGDVPVGMRMELPAALEMVSEAVGEILDAGCLPLVLGGSDILPCLGSAMALSARAEGTVGTLSLDAHGDNLPGHLGQRYSGATWGARMLELPHLRPENHVQLGMRGPRNFRDQVRWFQEAGSRLYTMGEIRRRGMAAVTEEALAIVHHKADMALLTIDYDVLDIGCAPGLDEPYGLSVPELLQLMYEAGRSGFDGVGLGWIPAPEPALYAIVIYSILYFLAGEAERKGKL